MKMKDILDNITIAAMVPIAIAMSIVLMIMSYLLVPLFIVFTVFFVLKTLLEIDQITKE